MAGGYENEDVQARLEELRREREREALERLDAERRRVEQEARAKDTGVDPARVEPGKRDRPWPP